MAQQNINIGTSANKGDGDPIRTAFTKVNANFTELYAKHDGTISHVGDVKGSVYGDDSTVLIDGVSSKVNLDGTVKGNIIPDTNVAYDIGAWGHAYLAYKFGSDTLLDTFYPNLQKLDWEGAFERAYGMSSEDFYEEFKNFLNLPLKEQLSILPKSFQVN